MTFPTIAFKSTNVEVEADIVALAEEKLASLEKHVGHADQVTCDVEFEKETAHANGHHWRVEANMYVNGTLYRAEATEENFVAAIEEVRNELDKRLRRSNDKRQSLIKRGGRLIKNALHRV